MASTLELREKVHVITRRLFQGDLRRHFVGVVTNVAGDQARIEGYVFIFNPNKNDYVKRPERRTRILSVAGGGSIVNVLPKNVEIDDLDYKFVNRRLMLTDGSGFSLDINEFGPDY